MALTVVHRKYLWAQSHGCCALCKCGLTEPGKPHDEIAVIGEEAHIVSPRMGGPRYRPLSAGEVDDQSNYLVLCPNDHTRIDKQPGFYTESKLREIRADHERWAKGRLIERRIPPMRIRDAQPGRPVPLYPATKGADVVGVVGGSHALLIAGKPDDLIEGEVELVGDFLQVLTDWIDIWDEIGPAHQLEVEYSMTKTLQELGDAGFGVLVGSRYQILEGGIGRPSNWRTAVVSVYRIKDQQ